MENTVPKCSFLVNLLPTISKSVVVAVVGTLLMMLVPRLAVRLAAIGEQSTAVASK